MTAVATDSDTHAGASARTLTFSATMVTMPVAEASIRPFTPGTTGWTARDLEDPAIEREWFKGSYEIVEGVLTTMPPAYFAGGNAAANLIFVLKVYSKEQKLRWRFAAEADIVINELRVPMR